MISNKYLMETFKNIGFYLIKSEDIKGNNDNNSVDNICETYRYYSSNLKDSHYTLIVYKYMRRNVDIEDITIDYRLYIHSNFDGSYIKSPFQSSNRDFIMTKLPKIFTGECRSILISEILN